MKAVRLFLTVTVLLANSVFGASESALPNFFESEAQAPWERELSMRYLSERNLSMRNLSMRYLAAKKSDTWGRSITDSEKAKLGLMAEESASFWDNRKLSMRYLREGKSEGVKRLRVAIES
mmetsp:Transcript_20515/g.29291  ORF Transcript_20515/g.29291 Transcript_20515/m.29291 type:complete len:121 (+) Transcript_20515:137-499(+)|eukprot:CAMPEP_0172413932 /NCGR_PEP_ID=MMETSP1064-20121228/502_1 /TAXON_ID=202472 /ORGANISM="Aulacoseira subarctica , Strain CCAP 1002/5" /LENGTH=120 /DNA_ID=CAMNT_0013150357 /DNA_START=108 /DNA_END=470 /DNA_ORIENTATION=+